MPAPRLPLPAHGGDLAAARERWGDPHGGWLDLSTGITPTPYPVPPIPEHAWTRLPGAAEDAALRKAAALRYGAASPQNVLPIPGSGAAIRMLPRLYAPSKVAVFGPTYGEHATAWAAVGHDVRIVSTMDQIGDAKVVVVVNPNNPDGRIVAVAQLVELANSVDVLIIDEAFGDCVPGLSVVPILPKNALVLRSFGKFHGLAGLRLGFAIGHSAELAPLAQALGPWPVSGPALAIGTQALADDVWSVRSLAVLQDKAVLLDAVLSNAGLEIVGGTPLFRFARHPDAHGLWDQLGRAGILVRAFAERPTKLRFGLPGSMAAMERLQQAL